MFAALEGRIAESQTKTTMQNEASIEKAKELAKKEGLKGWNMAKEMMLKHQTNSTELRSAINHVMLEYRPDFFRSAMVSLCSQAVNGGKENTYHCGAALTLIGRAIGIHDDIIDNLKTRNNHPTVYGKFGKEIALILSNALSFKGFTLLGKNFQDALPTQKRAEIFDTINRVWSEQCESETAELRTRAQTNVPIQVCLNKIMKRASELEAITRIGGILGQGSQDEIEILGKYGRTLGMMSLLRDEIIDMLELTMLRHRIRYESLPLPLIYAAQKPQVRSKIIKLIAKKRLTVADLKMISKSVNEAGGMSYVAKYISRKADEAYTYLDQLKNKKEELKLLISSLTISPEERQLAF